MFFSFFFLVQVMVATIFSTEIQMFKNGYDAFCGVILRLIFYTSKGHLCSDFTERLLLLILSRKPLNTENYNVKDKVINFTTKV